MVNPMYSHKVRKISPHITLITDPSGVFLFLAEGTREALLIDTGTGFSGLRETVATLTDKPLTVALTHMHPDHAGGASAFAKVYVHPADIPAFRAQTLEDRMGYAASQMPGIPLAPSDFLPPVEEESRFLPLEDGTVFDLGGFQAEFIHVPGHTLGSCCVLFPQERSILFGDACNCNTLIMFESSISQYRRSLLKLQGFRNRFDRVYYSHGAEPEGPGRSLEDNLELCDEILAGKDDAIPCDFLGMSAIRAKAMTPNFLRLDGKYGNIVYTPRTKC